jgi:hypothetical protein
MAASVSRSQTSMDTKYLVGPVGPLETADLRRSDVSEGAFYAKRDTHRNQKRTAARFT